MKSRRRGQRLPGRSGAGMRAVLSGLSPPRTVWSRAATPLVVVTVLCPPLATLWMVPDLRDVAGVATATQFVVAPTTLAAAVLLYFQFRITASSMIAWGTLCLTIYSVEGVMLAGLRAGHSGSFFDRPGWILTVDLAVATLMMVSLRRAARTELPVDPLAAGLLVGLLVCGLYVLVNEVAPGLSMTSPAVLVIEVALLVVGLGIGRAVARWDGFPRWFLARLGIGTLALIANRLASSQENHASYDVVATVTGIIGAVLMVTTAAACLRVAVQEQDSSLASLSHQVAAMEAEQRDKRARLHEITNSISSIAVASSLLHHAEEVSPGKRRQLERMLEAEAGRLARILTRAGGALDAGEADDPAEAHAKAQELIDLDEVLEPLVVSHQALRRRVEWEPSGVVAVGDPDAVAEAVNILLDNAARHAPQAQTRIEVTDLGDTVEIAVHDDGPGVPDEVRRRLFEWGGRGSQSKGQGIGLHLAHQLMSNAGNSLRLEADGTGTTFVIGLPAPGEAVS